MTRLAEVDLLEEGMNVLEKELEAVVRDLPFFKKFIKKIREAPKEEWPQLLEEFEIHLDLDIFAHEKHI